VVLGTAVSLAGLADQDDLMFSSIHSARSKRRAAMTRRSNFILLHKSPHMHHVEHELVKNGIFGYKKN
jgi:hypothetical protein